MNCIRSLIEIGKGRYLLNKSINFTSNVRKYAFKSDLKIKWIHPGKVSGIAPEKSGDLEQMHVIDKNLIQFKFRNCKELEDASDIVKRLFSLEFAPRRKTSQIYIKNTTAKVKRHPLDAGSAETRIARWTGCIRSFQEVMDKFPRNKRMKVMLLELIDKRKKLLKRLRKWDYKRFEWLIDNLNIVYKPEPINEKTITRKVAMVKLTDIYCNNIRNERLDKYKLQLEAEQPSFLEGKIDALEFIRKEQTECGVDVTVSQDEIDTAKKQLNELLLKREANKPKEE